MQVEHPAYYWVNPDLERGFWVLQAGFLHNCAEQLSHKTQAAAVLLREATAHESVALVFTNVREQDGVVVYGFQGVGRYYHWGACSFTLPSTCNLKDSSALVVGFVGNPATASGPTG